MSSVNQSNLPDSWNCVNASRIISLPIMENFVPMVRSLILAQSNSNVSLSSFACIDIQLGPSYLPSCIDEKKVTLTGSDTTDSTLPTALSNNLSSKPSTNDGRPC